MNKGLYFIYDREAEDISPIFEAKTQAIAMRQFANALVASPYPEEYELHQVGEVEYQESIDTVLLKPFNRLICNGLEVKDYVDKINAIRTRREVVNE